jgi:xanthine dehydrogenase accessory factor
LKSVDQIVLGELQSFLAQAKLAWLCTVVKTFGASPRPLGSMLALDSEGNIVGSLSGGCIEDELLEKLRNGALASNGPEILEYGVTAEENERFGLPCGGRMQILLEPLKSDESRRQQIEEILSALAARQPIRRRVDLASGQWLLESVATCQSLSVNDGWLVQDFGPRYQLLLVGANELARCIAEIALAMDYRVLVCDPREDRRAQWSVNGAELLAGMPDEVVSQCADPFTAVITLTHDPRIDDMALMQALDEELFYVGALGSVRTSAKRRERLLQLDISEQQLQNLRAPVGLPLGSKSAMEIAVAIMAELIQRRTAVRSRLQSESLAKG